ncbi:MAG: hypothetical protein BBJ57_01370 [Desulfobacterales bacterium PC51MH44]|nr:MAG: hypothetical protein BBJ57_01370 [Desulfobacterales bacterium PC51MH44]
MEDLHHRTKKKGGDFYCFAKLLVPNGHQKYSYHPSGATHSKRKKDKKVNKEDYICKKFNWPDYKDMTIVPIDGHGFEAKDFIKDDPVFQNMKETEIKPPAIVFDISCVVALIPLESIDS